MASSTTKLNLTKPDMNLLDQIQTTIEALANNFQIIDDNIILLAELQALLDALESELNTKVETADSSLSTAITNNKIAIENALTNHINHVTAHPSSRISYSGSIQGVNNAKSALDALYTRIESIIAQSSIDPNKDQELVDARNSTYKATLYDNLRARLDMMDIHPKYFWIEEHTVPLGGNTIVLVNPVLEGQVIEIYDKKFQIQWFDPENWQRNLQTITFTSPMPESLTFRVKNIG